MCRYSSPVPAPLEPDVQNDFTIVPGETHLRNDGGVRGSTGKIIGQSKVQDGWRLSWTAGKLSHGTADKSHSTACPKIRFSSRDRECCAVKAAVPGRGTAQHSGRMPELRSRACQKDAAPTANRGYIFPDTSTLQCPYSVPQKAAHL